MVAAGAARPVRGWGTSVKVNDPGVDVVRFDGKGMHAPLSAPRLPSAELGEVSAAAVSLIADEERGSQSPVRVGVQAGSGGQATEGGCRQRRRARSGRLDEHQIAVH